MLDKLIKRFEKTVRELRDVHKFINSFMMGSSIKSWPNPNSIGPRA